jgi:hypothetical protein
LCSWVSERIDVASWPISVELTAAPERAPAVAQGAAAGGAPVASTPAINAPSGGGQPCSGLVLRWTMLRRWPAALQGAVAPCLVPVLRWPVLRRPVLRWPVPERPAPCPRCGGSGWLPSSGSCARSCASIRAARARRSWRSSMRRGNACAGSGRSVVFLRSTE